MTDELRVRHLGRQPYAPTWAAMQALTASRDGATPDELWCLEHPPVFTLGRAAARAHVRDPGSIPVVAIDRGGEVTYHGPGQLVIYTLVDLRRMGLGVRAFVELLEDTIIALLARFGVAAARHTGAPGVYVDGCKIAALGLRVRRGCCCHGLAVNVDCDLEPFARIDPCGYRDLAVTRTLDQGIAAGADELNEALVAHVAQRLGYARVTLAAPHLEAV
jgi:lipoyl(octanoyl) transferase